MNYFKEYEARRNLYKNIKPGSLWKWDNDYNSIHTIQIVEVKNRVVYYRYCNETIYLQGIFRRGLVIFQVSAVPFEPVVELEQ
jgi:hypothetical protein